MGHIHLFICIPNKILFCVEHNKWYSVQSWEYLSHFEKNILSDSWLLVVLLHLVEALFWPFLELLWSNRYLERGSSMCLFGGPVKSSRCCRGPSTLASLFSSGVCPPVWVKVAQSRLTLCDPMDCSPPGSPVHGILQARILEWVAMPSSGGSSQPRHQTQVSCVACDSLPSEPYLCLVLSSVSAAVHQVLPHTCAVQPLAKVLWVTHVDSGVPFSDLCPPGLCPPISSCILSSERTAIFSPQHNLTTFQNCPLTAVRITLY